MLESKASDFTCVILCGQILEAKDARNQDGELGPNQIIDGPKLIDPHMHTLGHERNLK